MILNTELRRFKTETEPNNQKNPKFRFGFRFTVKSAHPYGCLEWPCARVPPPLSCLASASSSTSASWADSTSRPRLPQRPASTASRSWFLARQLAYRAGRWCAFVTRTSSSSFRSIAPVSPPFWCVTSLNFWVLNIRELLWQDNILGKLFLVKPSIHRFWK
jgi:hypothetical protein